MSLSAQRPLGGKQYLQGEDGWVKVRTDEDIFWVNEADKLPNGTRLALLAGFYVPASVDRNIRELEG